MNIRKDDENDNSKILCKLVDHHRQGVTRKRSLKRYIKRIKRYKILINEGFLGEIIRT